MLQASSLTPVEFAQLPGWSDDDHQAALEVFRRSAAVLEQQFFEEKVTVSAGLWEDWAGCCEAAFAHDDAKAFFEEQFQAFTVTDDTQPNGLFTGYYEPQLVGRLVPSAQFCVPLYGRPDDLLHFTLEEENSHGFRYGRISGGAVQPYFTREDIETGALSGRGLEVLWLDNWVDAFFVHVQGSARITVETGQVLRVQFSAKSGLPYTSIGALLAAKLDMPRDNMSMQLLRSWMESNPAEARELMWSNHSFIFFEVAKECAADLGAIGAGQVPLTPGRSLAVDKRWWNFGLPIWLDLYVPAAEQGENQPFRQLMIAQDTGSAITGPKRGDVYWGWGAEAENIAGRMAVPGKMVVLLPRILAERQSLGSKHE